MFPKRLLAPGFLTVMNLFLGFYAIILSAKGDLPAASWIIIIAAVFDAVDGKVARATKSSSKFGVEFDSLADITSFGVAPSFLIYEVYLKTMSPPVGLIISFFPLMFGAIRLARFNTQVSGAEKVNFKGLPTPAASALLASFIIFNFYYWSELRLSSFMLPLTFLASILMVSTIEFDAMPRFSLRSGRKNSLHLAAVLISLIIVVFFPQSAIFPMVIIYIVYSAGRALYRVGREGGLPKRRKTDRGATQDADEENGEE